MHIHLHWFNDLQFAELDTSLDAMKSFLDLNSINRDLFPIQMVKKVDKVTQIPYVSLILLTVAFWPIGDTTRCGKK